MKAGLLRIASASKPVRFIRITIISHRDPLAVAPSGSRDSGRAGIHGWIMGGMEMDSRLVPFEHDPTASTMAVTQFMAQVQVT